MINMDHMSMAMELLAQGMAGIFVVLGVIAILVAMMQKLGQREKNQK